MKPLAVLSAALLGALMALPASIRAEDGPTPAEMAAQKAAIVSAHGLVDLFAQSCIAYADNIPRLRLWLDGHARQATEGQSRYFLAGMTGKAWLQSSKMGNYAVAIGDANGPCIVKAQKGPVSEVAAYLRTAAIPRLKQTGELADAAYMGGPGKSASYVLTRTGEDYKIALTGSDKGTMALQSQLTLAAPGKSP